MCQIIGIVVLAVSVLVAIFSQSALSPSTADGVSAKMRAIVVSSASEPREIKVAEVDVPQPNKDQLLIRVEAAPVNPSDIYYAAGNYRNGSLRYPYTPGFEGAGVVVGHGGNPLGALMMGQRVAFGCLGCSWAQYAVASVMEAMPLPSDVDTTAGSATIVNPVTMVAMIDAARSDGHNAFVQTAAASKLGQMMVKYCLHEGYPLINVVRRQAQRELLVSLGAKPEHVLLSTDENYQTKLEALITLVGVTAAFDAVAAESTPQLIDALPSGGAVYVYGWLGGDHVGPIRTTAVMGEQKVLKGFSLAEYFQSASFPRKLFLMAKTRSLLSTLFKTEFAAEYSLEEASQAVTNKSLSTNSKFVILPHKE